MNAENERRTREVNKAVNHVMDVTADVIPHWAHSDEGIALRIIVLDRIIARLNAERDVLYKRRR